jgi:hypothetical protein
MAGPVVNLRLFDTIPKISIAASFRRAFAAGRLILAMAANHSRLNFQMQQMAKDNEPIDLHGLRSDRHVYFISALGKP